MWSFFGSRQELSGKLKLRVIARSGVLWDKEVAAVSSYNSRGVFDILPEHSQFVTTVQQQIVAHHPGDKKEVMELPEGGLLYVKADVVEVYVGI